MSTSVVNGDVTWVKAESSKQNKTKKARMSILQLRKQGNLFLISQDTHHKSATLKHHPTNFFSHRMFKGVRLLAHTTSLAGQNKFCIMKTHFPIQHFQ
jgi:hypothetical protein